jgi:hypothetical protein
MERYQAARQAEVLAALAEKEALHQVPSTAIDKCGGNCLEQLNMLVDIVFVRVIVLTTFYLNDLISPSLVFLLTFMCATFKCSIPSSSHLSK